MVGIMRYLSLLVQISDLTAAMWRPRFQQTDNGSAWSMILLLSMLCNVDAFMPGNMKSLHWAKLTCITIFECDTKSLLRVVKHFLGFKLVSSDDAVLNTPEI